MPATDAKPEPAKTELDKPAPQATAKPITPTMSDDYVIGELDSISVTVFKEPTLSAGLLVRPDGMITLPLLGDIKASGKTPLKLANDIATALKAYVQDPSVTVVLTGMNSKIIYLIGEIGHTGPMGMTPGMTLLQAIASAGGLSQYANAKKIYILRIVNGTQQKIPVQYKQALKGDLSLNLPLIPGDTIVVP
jgi:polysaccharide export outer membrane protein